jgi:hypothetical protein
MKAVIHSALALVAIFSLGITLRGAGIGSFADNQLPVMTDFVTPILQSRGAVGVLASAGSGVKDTNNQTFSQQHGKDTDFSPDCEAAAPSSGMIGFVLRWAGWGSE